MTPSLKSIQNSFAGSVLSSEGNRSRVFQNLSLDLIHSERFGVYGEGYLARMEESLDESFPATHRRLGEKHWNALVRAYAYKNPSVSYNLSDIGDRFPAFLKRQRLPMKHAYASELARMEWALHESFHETSEKPLDPGKLRSLTTSAGSSLRFSFQPWVRTFRSKWNALELRGNSRSPKPLQNCFLLIYRANDQVMIAPMERKPFQLLEKLMIGQSLGRACSNNKGITPEEISAWFSTWMQLRLFTKATIARA